MSASVAVITIAAGRRDHLAASRDSLAHGTVVPDHHVVVSMGDPDIPDATVSVPREGTSLPLARARNAGAAAAIDAGADVLVFLDVDCIAGPTLIERYRDHVTDGVLLCGPVTYLPRAEGGYPLAEIDRWTSPHAARPDPPDGQVEAGANYDLFWSLSFAVTPHTWRRIGGFCEEYRGYGGEDTDFAAVARRAGVGLDWLGGAHAYHQWHPVSSPPIEHLDDILTNCAVFHRRWGRWPMTGWLSAFEASGAIAWRDGVPVRSD